MVQVDDWDDYHHLPVASYEENLSIAEAYDDPRLQPVVVMKKLDEAWYFGTINYGSNNNEKALAETQTLRVGCSKAEPKIFAPLQSPFPGVQDSQNLISWRWALPSPTDPV